MGNVLPGVWEGGQAQFLRAGSVSVGIEETGNDEPHVPEGKYKYITQIKSLINNCLKEAMQSSNAKIINRYIHTLITVFQFVNCDSFGDELLNSLLIRAWSDNSERNKLPPEIPSLIHRLVNAVVSKNSDLFELILQELIKSYGKPNTYLVSNALNQNHEKNVNWWDRNKIDPNWWREQD